MDHSMIVPNTEGLTMDAEFESTDSIKSSESVGSGAPHLQTDLFQDNPADSGFVDYAGGSGLIILPEGVSRPDAIAYFNNQIPENEYGLPTLFYRSDMLPYPLHQMTEAELDAASVQINYAEGYPTFAEGRLIWEQLPHEQQRAFILFQSFLDQSEEVGIRQLPLLAETQKVGLQEVSDNYKEFYWSARAKAYDIFIVAANEKRRQARIRKIENRHFNVAQALEEKVLKLFEEPEYLNELSPAQALEALETLVRLQRTSLGLTGQHASSLVAAGRKGVSDSTMFKETARGAQDGAALIQVSQEMSALMANDPHFAYMAQQLILRTNTQHEVAPSNMPGANAGD